MRFELGWKVDGFRREFYYRKIIDFRKNKEYYIKNNEIKKYEFDLQEVTCYHCSNTSFSMIVYNHSYNIQWNKDSIIRLNKSTPLMIEAPIKFKVDGFFVIGVFPLSKFIENEEVHVYFHNISEEEIYNFQYVLVEVKLNKNKIIEIFEQLEKDQYIFYKFGYNNVLFIGIVNNFDDKKEGVFFKKK